MRRANTPDDVWKFVAEGSANECWPWQGHKTVGGYGYFTMNWKYYLAHRLVYMISNPGTITASAPKDKHIKQFVLHKCDNRACCNPNHLFLGNYKDNTADAKRKGRLQNRKHYQLPTLRGEDHPRSRLTNAQADGCRLLLKFGWTRKILREYLRVSERIMDRVARGESY